MAAWNEAPAAGGLGECAALVRSAEALRFSTPELAVQLARRALIVGAESADAADTDEARALSGRAHAVLAAGLVRMSHYADAVEPGFAALVLADGSGVADMATGVRLDLAACSREVGEPLLGCALLRPVLETAGLSPLVRAVALGRLVGCVAHVGRRDDIEDTLTEADRLLATDEGLSPDARRLERARLSVRAAAYHRWYGDTEDASEAAREGLTQLNRLRGLRPETARLRAQLVLELVCALLDEGALEEAASVSEAVLAEPVRATSAAAVGQLMLAVSTRVHLPSGRVERGRGLLDQAVWVAGRHGLDGLLADALTAVSQLDEKADRPVEALESLRNARAAEQRRLRSMSQAARRLLTEASPATWDVQAVNSLLRSVVRAATHQPARDWHLAAQRVAQSARQRTQADRSPHSTDPQTWPSDQPPVTPHEQHPQATERLAAAQSAEHATRPVDQHTAARLGESSPATPWVERAAAARSGEHPTTLSWAEQYAAGHPGEGAAHTGSGKQPAASLSYGQTAAAPSGEPAAIRPEAQAAAEAEDEHIAGPENQPAAGSHEQAASPQADEWPHQLGEPGTAARVGESGERGAAAHPGERGEADPSAEQEPSAGGLVSAAAERLHEPTDRDEATGLLNKDGLIRRLRSVRNGERPVALALVRLDNELGVGRVADPGTRPGAAADFEVSELAGRVRNIAPENAELARSDGTELAVLLPHTTRDQAERFTAAIESAWLGTANGASISTGVVQSNPDAPTVDARALINAARHALTPALTESSRRLRTGPSTLEELADLDDTGDTLRIGRAIISSLSIPAGSGGKRRAADPPASDQPTPNGPAAPEATSVPAAEQGRSAFSEAGSGRLADKPNSAEPAETPADGRDVGGRPPADGPGDASGGERASAGDPGLDVVGDSQPWQAGERDAGPGGGLADADAGDSAGPGDGEKRVVNGGWPPAMVLEAPQVGAGTSSSPGWAGERDTDSERTGGTAGQAWPGVEDAVGSSGVTGTHDGGRDRDGAGEPAAEREASVPAEAGSSPYEHTKAELALLMSALAAGNVSAAAPLPAPSRPVEDEPRNGASLPRQSIPTPPEPDEVPEPKPRPDIPDPGEPEPIPPVPPDPGPPPPDEPGPLTPPNAEYAGAADPGAENRSAGNVSTGSRGTGSDGAGDTEDTEDAEDTVTGVPSDRRTGGVSRLADAFRGGSYRPETAGSRPPGDGGTQGATRDATQSATRDAEGARSTRRAAPSESRRERSSTTIAGLLAEALAAYQETADEPEPQPERPKRPRDDFDRLFDWRYQSPASGRHRSPE